MADTITVPTYEQIVTILSKLATNYSNLASVFYDVFYNTTPGYVTFQMYNDSGVLQPYTIPNRAKDFRNFTSGNGTPEGSVDASLGVIYQDLENGIAYIKETADGNEGWVKFISKDMLDSVIIQGEGSPEGLVEAGLGILYVDTANAVLYIKGTSTGNVGWILISASTSILANRDLSNITSAGFSIITSLANTAIAGSSIVAGKQSLSDRVNSISGTDQQLQTKYPTAYAVKDLVENNSRGKANTTLSNLEPEGELKFINWSYVREGIISSPGGLLQVVSESNKVVSVPASMQLLGANGILDNSLLYNNLLMKTSAELISEEPTEDRAGNWIVFVEAQDQSQPNVLTIRVCLKDNFYISDSTPSIIPAVGNVWFSSSENAFKVWNETDWVQYPMTIVGEYTTNANGVITSISPRKLMEIVSSEHVVIEVGGDSTCWYRLYKDGWLEQGGSQTGNTAITLQKSFSGTSYTFVPSASVTAYTKAADSVTITAGASAQVDWMASGWSA